MKEYKTMQFKLKLNGKIMGNKIESDLNYEAKNGWKVVSASVGNFAWLLGLCPIKRLIVVLEREK